MVGAGADDTVEAHRKEAARARGEARLQLTSRLPWVPLASHLGS